MDKKLLFVLGKGLFPGEVGDQFGGFQGVLRVHAAKTLFHRYPETTTVLVSGGRKRGTTEPTLATFMGNFLVAQCAVPPHAIMYDHESTSTYHQLRYLNESMYVKDAARHITVLTNDWHLLRVQVMIEHLTQLSNLQNTPCILAFVSAEEILLASREAKYWSPRITRERDSDEVRKHRRNEAQGVAQIRAGTYVLK